MMNVELWEIFVILAVVFGIAYGLVRLEFHLRFKIMDKSFEDLDKALCSENRIFLENVGLEAQTIVDDAVVSMLKGCIINGQFNNGDKFSFKVVRIDRAS